MSSPNMVFPFVKWHCLCEVDHYLEDIYLIVGACGSWFALFEIRILLFDLLIWNQRHFPWYTKSVMT
jgi:hypothetical protein